MGAGVPAEIRIELFPNRIYNATVIPAFSAVSRGIIVEREPDAIDLYGTDVQV
jgi:hypothetical protein